jgi:cellulose biosynthesis protein BcsQ/Cdc6-like AAA superfamily ATPase
MLKVYQIIKAIEDHLEHLLQQAIILDYRIVLLLNHDVSIIIKTKECIESSDLPFCEHDKVRYEIHSECDILNDPYLVEKFEQVKAKFSISSRRRFDNILNHEISRVILDVPVLSFYSYKGGTGRTTALALFASYYAMHFKKKVVILDCDFEAPGFNNYYEISDETLFSKQGIIEYMYDSVYYPDLELDHYSIRVSSKFSGDGSIIVFPAGNLSQGLTEEMPTSNTTNLDHYLEALSRINFSGIEYMQSSFEALLRRISDKFNPDIVLIDNRTGFNDIYSNIGLTFSSMIIGFFGSNAQTVPGFESFIKQSIQKNIPTIVVNSIISDSRYYTDFKNNVFNPAIQILSHEPSDVQKSANLEQTDEEQRDMISAIPVFPLYRESRLETIGCSGDDGSEFAKSVKHKVFSNYNILFETIIEYASKLVPQYEPNTEPSQETEAIKESNLSKIGPYESDTAKGKKRAILETIGQEFPSTYAEEQNVTDDFINRSLFFRECMNDLLNKDKFLIIGNKGTGKTLIYKSFISNRFIEILSNKYGVDKKDYMFVNIIAMNKVDCHQGIVKFIDSTYINNTSELPDDRFYRRFWEVFIWNSIFLEDRVLSLGLKPSLDVSPVTPDESTSNYFLRLILNDNLMLSIEDDLNRLDNLLDKLEKTLIVAFDELDHVFKPHLWDETVAPLISYMRNHQFKRIVPKVFVRSDLYKKLGNITNKEQLRYRMIDIEWNSEELFGFFFKTLFSLRSVKKDFFSIIKAEFSGDIEKICRLESQCDDQFASIEDKHLKVLVELFFGKWADYRGTSKFGLSYDWFYNNLKNADGSISLRPFVDLIKYAVVDAQKPFNIEKNANLPILNQFYYTNPKTRVAAVETHINDISRETGNKDISKVFDYIKLQAPLSLRKFNLVKCEFVQLLNGVMKYYKNDLESNTLDSLRDVLINNGIISIIHKPGGYTLYSFAFLYKYYLGLRGRTEYS